ncbi:hypothetical protein SAMD00024442_123_2 [Candidatus Symbiothrix dinenymphae]|nr:hypothetical protein SAMD00024442_123_2 [Candidatus Symbiothrix dinenymphae]
MPKAERNLDEIHDYIAQNYTDREVNRFFAKLNKSLLLATQNPFMYRQAAQNRTIRRCVLSKQTSFVYKIKKDRIDILFMFDNRQNPNTLKFE